MTPITVKYFKASGKYYTDASFDVDSSFWLQSSPRIINMTMVVAEFKRMRNEGQAPGLSSDGKEFFAVLDCHDGYPCLIVT